MLLKKNLKKYYIFFLILILFIKLESLSSQGTLSLDLTRLLGKNVIVRSYLNGNDYTAGNPWPYREMGDGFTLSEVAEIAISTPITQTPFGPSLDGTQYFSVATGTILPDNERLIAPATVTSDPETDYLLLMQLYYKGGAVIFSQLDGSNARFVNSQAGEINILIGLQKAPNERAERGSGFVLSGGLTGSRLILEEGNFYTLCIRKKNNVSSGTAEIFAFLLSSDNATRATYRDFASRVANVLRDVRGLGGPGYQQIGENFKGIIYQVLSLRGSYSLHDLRMIDSYLKNNNFSVIDSIFSDGDGDPVLAFNSGTTAIIKGEKFGTFNDLGRSILFGSRRVVAEVWNDREIQFKIPDIQPGTYNVIVQSSFAEGKEKKFTVVDTKFYASLPSASEQYVKDENLFFPRAIRPSRNLSSPIGRTYLKMDVLKKGEKIKAIIYDDRGREIIVLLNNEEFLFDSSTISWDGRDKNFKFVKSGVYILKIETPSFKKFSHVFVLPSDE